MRTPLLVGTAASALLASLAIGGPPATAQDHLVQAPTITSLVSASPSGASSNGYGAGGALSADGRLVAWSDEGSNLVAGDTNNASDVFVRDMVTDVTERVSVSSTGAQANGDIDFEPSISRDGRFVAFASGATNMVAGDTNGSTDVFVRDRLLGTTERVSVSSAEAQGNGQSWIPQISGNGRYVAFTSKATNLVAGDTNAKTDVFVRDRQTGTTVRASVSDAEVQSGSDSGYPAISNDGRYVTFASDANGLAAGDTNGLADVFRRDLQAGTTIRVSAAPGGAAGSASSGEYASPISDDGRYVAFHSKASNLIAGDTNSHGDVFRRDITNGATIRVSVSTASAQATGVSFEPFMSANGDVIGFRSNAPNLVTGDTNGAGDVFQRTVSSSTTVRASVSTSGAQLAGGAGYGDLSADGSTISFGTDSGDAVATPAGAGTVFIRRKEPVTPFISVTGLVQQQAKDFARPLTAGQVDAQVARILSGFPSYERYIADLARSPQWSAKRAPVVRLYWAFFLRRPDTGGIDYWIKKVEGGAGLASVASNFAASSEFQNKYGKLDNTKFVTLVYQNVLQRDPDGPGLTHWVNKLKGGMKRGQMMTAFSESSEGIRKMAPQTETVSLSLAMLRVVPTQAQFDDWKSILAHGGPLEDVVTEILATPAYGVRITP